MEIVLISMMGAILLLGGVAFVKVRARKRRRSEAIQRERHETAERLREKYKAVRISRGSLGPGPNTEGLLSLDQILDRRLAEAPPSAQSEGKLQELDRFFDEEE